MQADFKKEWLEKAFRLAFFILEDRESAKRVATEALARLEVTSNAQFKRYYYTPTGRADAARAVRSRVTVNDLQLLQRLVFAEAEAYEREFEASRKASARRMLVHFIKHLVRITVKRNSFYVTLAMTRILHNYATSETLGLYNVVVQDPERVPDDYYCRSRKGLLMKELKARFDGLIATVKAARGEERFEGAAADDEMTAIAAASLREFTPWSSECHVPAKFDPFSDVLRPFHFDRRDPDDEHRIEVGRIHAVLHPECFARLAGALKLPSSTDKLEIPMFMINDARGDDDFGPRGPGELDEAEIDAIGRELKSRAERRKSMTVGMLRVVADGRELAMIDASTASSIDISLGESVEVIEIRGRGNGVDEILATHLMTASDFASGNLRRSLELGGGRSLTLDFRPRFDQFGDIESFDCAVATKVAVSPLRAFATWLWSPKMLIGATAVGALLLALALVFNLSRQRSGRPDDIATAPTPRVSPSPAASSSTETSPRPESSPSPESSPRPSVSPTPRAPAVIPATPNARPPVDRRSLPAPKRMNPNDANRPAGGALAREERRPEVDDDGILRLPIYERGDDARVTPRASRPRGVMLGAVRTIYIDITGDRAIGGMIREKLTDELERDGRFRITSNRETADAALKVFVRHEADGDEPEDRSATLIVRLVNTEGFVIYPKLRGATALKYVGVAVRLAPRIARDLRAASNAAR